MTKASGKDSLRLELICLGKHYVILDPIAWLNHPEGDRTAQYAGIYSGTAQLLVEVFRRSETEENRLA